LKNLVILSTHYRLSMVTFHLSKYLKTILAVQMRKLWGKETKTENRKLIFYRQDILISDSTQRLLKIFLKIIMY